MDTRSAFKRRVVVTGMGAVSPNGIGREAFWNATRRGQSGVRRISRFDPSSHKVQIAGEVTDFDESVFVAPKERQHVSRAVPLAVAASREAITDAGIEPKRMSREQLRTIGVLIGSGGGSQEFTEEQYRLYYSGLEKQCSVYAVPTVDDRHAGERDFDAVWVSRAEPHHIDGMHFLDRRARQCFS